VPAPVPESTPEEEDKSSRTPFEIDTIYPRCKSPLRLIVLIKNGDTIKKILAAQGLPSLQAPSIWPLLWRSDLQVDNLPR